MLALLRIPRRIQRLQFSLRALLLTTAGFALVLGLIVSVRSFRVWLSAEALRGQIASIQASGDPVSFAELAGEPVPRAVNAASYLERAEEGLSTMFSELAVVRQSKPYRAGHPTESDLRTIRSVLGAHAETISLVEQAASCPNYHPQMEYSTDLDSPAASHVRRIQGFRAVTVALEARSQLQLGDGEPEKSLETCIAMLRIARLAEKEPLMSGYLVALACRGVAIHSANCVLRSDAISRDGRDSLEAELGRQEGVEGYEWMLKTERVVGLETFQSLAGSGSRLTRVSRNQEQATYLTIFDEQLRLSSSTYEDFRDAYVDHIGLLESASLARQLFPAVRFVREAMNRVQAETRCLRLLNALQRSENQIEPNELDLTRLGLPPDAILDPFNGQQLRAKKLPDGWLVYSVGRNMKDDGGTIDPFLDVGVSPLLQLLPIGDGKAK